MCFIQQFLLQLEMLSAPLKAYFFITFRLFLVQRSVEGVVHA